MADFLSQKTQQSGIALGGIGTGSVELWPDGEFHYWQIANQSRWGGQCDQKDMDNGEEHAGALSFWVRTENEDGYPIVRKLGMKTDINDFTYRMYAWNKPVEEIAYQGRFPAATLEYRDRALPVKITLHAVGPFVPHETDLSSLPGFSLRFTLENPTDRPIKVSLVGALKPSFGAKNGYENELLKEEGNLAIHLSPVRKNWGDDRESDFGDLAISVSGGGEDTYLTADYDRFLREFVSHGEFGVTQESFLFAFREKGRLPDTKVGKRPRNLPEDLTELSDTATDGRVAELAAYPFARSFLDKMRRIKVDYPASREDKEGFLRYCRRQMADIGKGERSFGSAALGKVLTLAPHEESEVTFLFTWYFPNHKSRLGDMMGHYYENLCRDALDANQFLSKHKEIFEKAEAFSKLLYASDLPACFPEAWSTHLSTLVKDSWRIRNGKFGLWEGLGSCGFHTTDITYHASFGLVSLFPELQLTQMKMGAAFQREDGRVHHFFTPDLEHTDEGFDRVDMNPQFVLMVLRDYLFTGDKGYLDSLWGNVVRAMDSIESLDRDFDGLPDTDTARNTYDAWNFAGTTTYISVLWLASLKAAARLAEIKEDEKRRAHWEELREKGLKALEEKLWNGTYYDLWRTEDDFDACLMTDQLDGEWFLRMAGLEGNLPDARVREVMETIWKNNFDPEAGLRNATCPAGKKTSVFTYKNCQAEACWTGIGYAFSAMALRVGLPAIAETEIGAIHENQARLGEFWSHWECGAWYTRPMSSWTTLIALSGMKLDREKKTLSLIPVRNARLPLIFPGVLAEVTFTGEECRIRLLSGSLEGYNITSENRKIVIE